jgi:coatomer subunit zeta
MEEVIHKIKGILILDENGKKLFGKYYDKQSTEKQKQFEEELFSKSQKTKTFSEEVLIIQNYITVFTTTNDLIIYIMGDITENELVLAEVLNGLKDSLNQQFSDQFEKRTLLENFDFLLLTVEEMIDDGIIMELDSESITERVTQSSKESDQGDYFSKFLKVTTDQIKSSWFSFS